MLFEGDINENYARDSMRLAIAGVLWNNPWHLNLSLLGTMVGTVSMIRTCLYRILVSGILCLNEGSSAK